MHRCRGQVKLQRFICRDEACTSVEAELQVPKIEVFFREKTRIMSVSLARRYVAGESAPNTRGR